MRNSAITLDSSSVCEKDLASAAEALRAGGVVAFRTDTVYGLGVNGMNPSAVAKLRRLRKLADDALFPVHLAGGADAAKYLSDASSLVRRLARRCWPGPVTLLCRGQRPSKSEFGKAHAEEQLQAIYSNGSVALRAPDDPIAQALAAQVDFPLLAAGASGPDQPPCTDADTLRAILAGTSEPVDAVLEGGPTKYRKPSTVVEVNGDAYRVLSVGATDSRTIARWAQSLVIFVCSGNSCRSPMAEHMFRAELKRQLNGADPEALGYQIASAGTSAVFGGAISDGAARELENRGISAASHRSQPVTPELLQKAERIYTMTDEHRRSLVRTWPGVAERVESLDASGPVSDPFGGDQAMYTKAAEQIEAAVAKRVKEFLDEDRRWE